MMITSKQGVSIFFLRQESIEIEDNKIGFGGLKKGRQLYDICRNPTGSRGIIL